jgi:hypothetical protein
LFTDTITVEKEQELRNRVNLSLDTILVPTIKGNHDCVYTAEGLLQHHASLEITLPGIYLLSEKSTKSNVICSPQFNYRQVKQQNFNRKGITHQPSMHDAAMTPGGESFQNGAMHMLCYKRGILDTNNDVELKSISKVNYELADNSIAHNVTVQMHRVAAHQVDRKDILRLATILNSKIKETEKNKDHLFDYHNLFEMLFGVHNGNITNDKIKSLVLSLVIKFPINMNKTPQENWDELGEYLRFLTPIRFGNIEGNHRLEYMSRVGQGYEIGATVPLQRKLLPVIPPGTSTVYKKISSKIWLTKGEPISKEFITKVSARSEELQSTKELSIRNTIHTVIDEIANIIYKETNAGNKPGSTIDLFDLATSNNINKGPMLTLKEIHERLFQIVVGVLFKMEPTKEEMRSINVSKKKFTETVKTKKSGWFGITSAPFKKVS